MPSANYQQILEMIPCNLFLDSLVYHNISHRKHILCKIVQSCLQLFFKKKKEMYTITVVCLILCQNKKTISINKVKVGQ